MHGTTRGLPSDSAARLAELERHRPEWRGWLRLLAEVTPALDGSGMAEAPAGPQSGETENGRADGLPLLQGRTLVVDAARLQQLVRRLASLASDGHAADLDGGASSLRRYLPSRNEVLALLRAAVLHDQTGIGVLAAEAGVDPGALASIADLAAVPVLHACGRSLGAVVPRHWPHGHCPICAARPLLAERRGLDRSRWARCGRCGGEWEVQWLCCLHCGERDHERLGSLVLEAEGDVVKVETCRSCRGYLKSVATLQALLPLELLLRDLETVELDLVALDRGYRRPEPVGMPLDVRIVARG
jgi:FdhE protein